MSRINPNITNDMVIPTVENASWLFERNPDARFAVGIIAVGNEVMPGMQSIHDGYMMLRGRVYATQTRMISDDHLVESGPQKGAEKTDPDDERSVHFGVLENLGDEGVRFVGCQRHIKKNDQYPEVLPIEQFFPGVFKHAPATPGSFEASRYIQRHPDPRLQDAMTVPLFTKALTYALARSEEPAYGVVEEPVEEKLSRIGLPITRIAEPLLVPEYGANNLGLVIDLPEMARRYGVSKEVIENARRHEFEFNFFGTVALSASTEVA